MRNIQQEIEGFKKSSIQFLRDEYIRIHKVCSTSDLTKGDLVMGILLAKHGQKRMDEYFALKKEIKK